MKVDLIHFTGKGSADETYAAANLLIFTKSTRLNMTPNMLEEIERWPEQKKLDELKYMAGTIPSSWEMVDYIFAVQGVSRAFTHQAVRTRTASYAQQSLRVVEAGSYDFVMPKSIAKDKLGKGKVDSFNSAVKSLYGALREAGFPAEDARSILPTNIATNIVCKYNLRTLTELARSRTGGRTQDEYQDVVNAMIDAVVNVHPWTEVFFAPKGRDYFKEIEEFAKREFPDLLKRGELLKIVDHMRKAH